MMRLAPAPSPPATTSLPARERAVAWTIHGSWATLGCTADHVGAPDESTSSNRTSLNGTELEITYAWPALPRCTRASLGIAGAIPGWAAVDSFVPLRE